MEKVCGAGRVPMNQGCSEREVVSEVATQALKNELTLAVRLLQSIEEARETIAREIQLVESARGAFRHAAEALNRMPPLSPEDMQKVQQLMDEFRSALRDLEA